MSKQRVAELDLLRFVAATMVVVYHYTYRPVIDGQVAETAFDGFQAWSRYGYLGVPLFFLISGFVILWSADGRTTAQFVRSRFLRLYPMFWVAVAITFAVLWFAGAMKNASPGMVLANLTILPGYLGAPMIDGVYWTLAVEFKFYVIVGLLIATGQMRRIEPWLLVWLAALLANEYIQNGIVTALTIGHYGYLFVGGCLCYLIRSRGVSWPRVGALAICMLASMYKAIEDRVGFTQPPLLGEPAHVALITAGFYAMLFFVATRGSKGVEDSPFLYSLGALTYPLYLLHNAAGRVVFASLSGMSEWGRFAITSAVAFAAAWACATYLEPRARAFVASCIPRGWGSTAPSAVKPESSR